MNKTLRYAALLACLALASSARARAGMIVNGGFETGDFTGWTTVPAGSGSDFGVDDSLPHNGGHEAFFAGISIGSYDEFSQSVPTVAGTNYAITFWVSSIGSGPADLQVDWDGNRILDILNPDAFDYTRYAFTEIASSSSTPLSFQGYDFFNGILIDDVDVVAVSGVPEPSSIVLIGLAGIAVAGHRWCRIRLLKRWIRPTASVATSCNNSANSVLKRKRFIAAPRASATPTEARST